MTTTRTNRSQFKPGHDPRRHRFTKAECPAGFWAAINSIVARYPDAITDVLPSPTALAELEMREMPARLYSASR